MNNNERPLLEEIDSAKEFDRWYWMKEELVEICKILRLPISGRKNELRQRIIDYWNGKNIVTHKSKPKSSFNWAKEELTLETVITDSITFGRNVRSFLKGQINNFTCSMEFMEWVKSNVGKTLNDAVLQYPIIENQIKQGNTIDKSDFNVMNAYIEEFMLHNPDLGRREAMKAWDIKKYMPAKKGLVKYSDGDIYL